MTAQKNSRPPLTGMQIITLVAIVLGAVVVVNFAQLLAQSQRLVDSANQVGTEVAALETEQAALKTQIAYATTDASVIEWAHSVGKLVQPGEVLVVPIVPTPAATPTPPTVALPPAPPNWQLWRDLFFGTN